MQVFEENLKLKEKVRDFEVDDEHESEFNTREKIEHNLLFLMEINQKIEESMEARKALDKRLEQFTYAVGLTPEDLNLERNASSIKLELNRKIEELNFDNLRLKKSVKAGEIKNENLEEKLHLVEKKLKKVTEDKSSLVDSYETRIAELKGGYKGKYSSSKSKTKDSLNKELLSTRDELESFKKKYEELEGQMKYMEN